ncbi:MAG: alanine racemase [Methylococcales bacterium]|nr:alanine racemase [Methylococcales bacterium]MDD5754618.1 alanine racemase [Methylococcales bacterium]
MTKKLLKTWQKPSIIPHQLGTLNKFGRPIGTDCVDKIDGVAIEDLLREYGSPLFVISEKRLRDNVRQLKRTFESRYQPVIHAWSYKTNYLNAVCATLHQEGSWAEVVSAFEYEKARNLGVPGSRILFNGPHKSRAILERCIAEGARIHIDNLDELHLLNSVARELDKFTAVTLRLNLETGYTQEWSRFGFNLESGAALDAAIQISTSSHLKLRGLHSHIGTFILDARAYQVQVEKMIEFMELLEQQNYAVIDSLDIGGGFASQNAMQGLYLPAEQVVPSMTEYADAICSTLLKKTANREAQGKPRLTLILESGRAVVDDSEVLISSVVASKRLPDGRASYVMDAGVNLLFTAFWYDHRVKPTRSLQGVAEETVLYGPLCMNIDVIRKSIRMQPLSVGDSLVISPIGAYNNTQWMQFIEYRPNVVMIHEKEQVSVVRRNETLADFNQFESLPTHLNGSFKFSE